MQKVKFTKSPITADIDFLTDKLNQETPEFGEAYSFEFFIRDKASQIIAGFNGSVIFGCIYTDMLSIRK